MKGWVNVYIGLYNRSEYYVSKSYATKREAVLHVQTPHMEDRYVDTVNLNELLNQKCYDCNSVWRTDSPKG